MNNMQNTGKFLSDRFRAEQKENMRTACFN
jgi:hypothetical protein